jgi:death-on-curing protein
MKQLVWLDIGLVLMTCRDQLGVDDVFDYVRDLGLLESAINRPVNAFYYGRYNDIPAIAAIYAFGICQNHAFVDGNKRTALAASEAFLQLNDYELNVTNREAVQIFLLLADGKINESELVNWFRNNSIEL